jgi:hypothetical protein
MLCCVLLFAVPSYNRTHHVLPTTWNYSNQNTTTSDTKEKDQEPSATDAEGVNPEPETASEKLVDLSRGPPPYGKETVSDQSDTEVTDEKQVC